MPYYYDKDGEIIIESMQDFYYKNGWMDGMSILQYEKDNPPKTETSKDSKPSKDLSSKLNNKSN